MRQTCHLRFPRHGEPDPPSSRMSWRFPISLRLYNLVYYVQMKFFRRLLIVLLLALSSLFVGCASTSDMKVLVSNYRDDYSIYCDGELACPTSYGCVVSVSLKKDKVLLQKEFRLACNKWIITFPAGLIDAGETPKAAAKRELKEETGVELIDVIDILPPCFTCQGFSDELMSIIIGVGQGEPIPSNDPSEEIIPKWYTKEEVKQLFKNQIYMSVRTQMFLYQWINED